MSELIYGRRAVLETLRAGRRRIYRLWLQGTPDSTAKQGDSRRAAGNSGNIVAEISGLAEAQNVPIKSIQGGLFDKLAQQNQNAQGVALEVGDYPYVEPDAILAYAESRREPPFLLILDHLQDPQNMGTLFRTAEALGVHGAFIPDRRAAGITAAVSNAGAGAVEHLRVAQVTNINRLLEELKELNVWSVGLDGAPSTPALDAKMLAGPIALVVGSEGSGLSRLTRETCDLLARLPMVGEIESLNAAVAGSIALYIAAQTRTGTTG